MYIGLRKDFDAIERAEASPLESVLRDRAERGLSGILFEIYCAAYAHGAGIDDDTPHSESMRSLIWLLADRHRVECPAPPPATADELPGWLLTLARQAETIEGKR